MVLIGGRLGKDIILLHGLKKNAASSYIYGLLDEHIFCNRCDSTSSSTYKQPGQTSKCRHTFLSRARNKFDGKSAKIIFLNESRK